MTNDELLHKWINGTLSEEEEIIFKQRPEYDSLTEVYRLTEDLEAPNFDDDLMLSNILKTKKEKPLPKKSARIISFPNYIKYGIAATILIFGTWFFFFYHQSKLIQIVASEEKIEGTLPDQSTFVLNLGSELAYDEKNWGTERRLDLEGEAFFEVKKGATFNVYTKNGIVQVLGTQFNVWSRDDILEVTCQSGKVAVLSSNQKLLKELNPREVVRILPDQSIEEWTVSAAEKADWIKGLSSFKNVPLATVLDEIERQFAVTINSQNINQQEELSCNFQHKDLNLALKTSLTSLGIQYRIDGKTVLIFKE